MLSNRWISSGVACPSDLVKERSVRTVTVLSSPGALGRWLSEYEGLEPVRNVSVAFGSKSHGSGTVDAGPCGSRSRGSERNAAPRHSWLRTLGSRARGTASGGQRGLVWMRAEPSVPARCVWSVYDSGMVSVGRAGCAH